MIGSFDNASATNTPLTAALPSGTFAVGFDLGDFYASPGFSATVTPAGGVPLTDAAIQGGQPLSGSGGGFDFVGFVSSSPLSGVTFSGPPGTVTGASFDNFTYAVGAPSASPAPEPSQVGTLALLGLGLAGLIVRARRRQSAD